MVYHDESTMSNEQPEKDTFKACLYWRTKVIGSWRPQQKRHLYNEFALFKNYNRSYSIPLNMSNVGKFFWRWIQKKYVWVQERERRSFWCEINEIIHLFIHLIHFSWLRALHKTFRTRTSRTFIVVQLRSKNVQKKVCCTCNVDDTRSRCHYGHLWWNLRVTRTNHNTGNNSMNQSAGRRCQAREKRMSGNCDWIWFRSDWLKKWRGPIIKHDNEAFLREIFVAILLSRN